MSRGTANVLLLALACLALLAGCPGTGRYVGSTSTIEYSIAGATSSVDVVYAVADGYSHEAVAPPWSYKFTAEKGQHVYLQAQNQGNAAMTLTISKDGTVWSTETYSADVGALVWLDMGNL